MTPKRKQRLTIIAVIVVGVGAATILALNAFNENLMFFFAPSEVVAGEAPREHAFRLGGMVVPGSVRREAGSIEVKFDLTDNKDTVTVLYSGILPDLFREGQGIVSRGKLRADGVFVADALKAAHDEAVQGGGQ
jgi:cytochrome c-type biogenesis protein CcmE